MREVRKKFADDPKSSWRFHLIRLSELYCSRVGGGHGYSRAMSERSIHLRDQAEKCRAHARAISDVRTQGELRKLAYEYIARAVVIESAELAAP